MSPSSAQINVEQEFSEKLTIHKNLDQEVIVITVDKIRLCLIEHRDTIGKKREWLLPLGLLSSFVPTLVAADFKKFILEASVWQAIYIIATGICVVWLLISCLRAWRHRKAGDIKEVVRSLMAQQVAKPNEPNT